MCYKSPTDPKLFVLYQYLKEEGVVAEGCVMTALSDIINYYRGVLTIECLLDDIQSYMDVSEDPIPEIFKLCGDIEMIFNLEIDAEDEIEFLNVNSNSITYEVKE